jgi:hypothetical protein
VLARSFVVSLFLLLGSWHHPPTAHAEERFRDEWIQYLEESKKAVPPTWRLPELDSTVRVAGTEPGRFGGRQLLRKE